MTIADRMAILRVRGVTASASACAHARATAMLKRHVPGTLDSSPPDDLIDLFHQLGQHTQADTNAQGEQPISRSPDQLAERLLHPQRQHGRLRREPGRSERYG
jgi:hypothetical protein